ncbi:MAG: hypothetical protein FI707_08135 [SAR202 cluster bacterium]|jgi:Fe-S cluster assembly iron-binding protein IscA|nr:hypothetical protein [SAR202 cluster bacterium]HAL49066.1 hypothetical protein [Dehalococcoidia bacterium]MDP6663857.1 hypothetical protein [SAR202 cluster bacterium]MDP6799632.1 hypothetical protein [SAR202 cluster bacterium]MQG57647.1 hypothetical protein [SAR202 cluster bacterium]|tara:strand:- start:3655 stop:3939 length:285 start_codon:yes stop_codon:yes gene_type:complete
MLKITPAARKELKRIVDDRKLDVGRCLRLAIPPAWTGAGDFGIVIDGEKGGDRSVLVRGVKVLLLDEHLLEKLASSKLDFKESPQGIGFTLDVY